MISSNLAELKQRFLITLGCFVIVFLVSFFWASKPLLNLILTYTHHIVLEAKYPSFQFVYGSLPEAFFIKLKLSLWSTACLIVPIIEYQLYQFMVPGLYKKEKKWLYALLLSFPLFFLLGSFFLFLVVLPNALLFFMTTAQNLGSTTIPLLANLENSMHFFGLFVLVFGLSFQLPIILIFLVQTGILHRSSLQKNRKYVVVFIFTLAAFLTPPDLLSQVALAIPLVLLYEGTILFLRMINKREK